MTIFLLTLTPVISRSQGKLEGEISISGAFALYPMTVKWAEEFRKINRDISGISLSKRLEKFEYSVTRQTGSHIRLTTQRSGEHHLTIPRHDPLKIGTLSSVLNAVAEHFNISREEFINELF